MITRTGMMLALAAGAWAVGGVVAITGHWHPFLHRHVHAEPGMHALVAVDEIMLRQRVRARVTDGERAVLPRLRSSDFPARALEVSLEHELNERTAPHRIHDPSSRAVLIASHLASARPSAIADFDPMVLWPSVAARLEASGSLPPRVQAPGLAEIHLRRARRDRR